MKTNIEDRAQVIAAMKAKEKAHKAPSIQRAKPQVDSKNDSYPEPAKKADKKPKSKAPEADKQADKPVKPSKAELAVARVETLPKSTVDLKANAAPGVEIATSLQSGFDRLNDRLFENKVEPCVLTLSKLKRSYGHFWHSQFARRSQLKGKVHEIGIDLRRLADEGHATDIDVLSTIAHEMAHAMVYQIDKADADKDGKQFKPKTYHCAVWAALMNKIGLKPINVGADGLPTGKETGQHCSHEIVKGGPFEVAAKELIAEGFKFQWASVGGFYDENGRPVVVKVGKGGSVEVGDQPEAKPRKSKAGAKAKHSCPTCNSSAWGKPSMVLTCKGTKEAPHDPVEMVCERDEYDGD